MAEYPPDDAAADASDLDEVTRAGIARILARALAEYEELGAGPQVGDGDQWFDAVLAEAEAPIERFRSASGVRTLAQASVVASSIVH